MQKKEAPDELPIRPPFQEGTERLCVAIFLLALFAFPFLISWLPFQRSTLLKRIPVNETDGAFLAQEIFQESGPVELLLVGPCTTWWHIYPPMIQDHISLKKGSKPTVINLGFNHFGSDIMYLIIKDIMSRRRVKNLVLTLPKVEDIKSFPHANAVQWWIYPRDIQGIIGLSPIGHIKLFGLSLFSSIERLLRFTTPAISQYIARKGLGYNESREHLAEEGSWDGQLHSQISEIPLLREKIAAFPKLEAHVSTLEKARNANFKDPLYRKPHLPSMGDWREFFRNIDQIAQKNQSRVTFVDSPHATDFEKGTPTTAWPLIKDFSSSTPLIEFDFTRWRQEFSDKEWSKILRGSNFTPLGARLFTQALLAPLQETLNR